MNYFFHILLIVTLLFGGCRSSGKTQDSAESNITGEVKSLKVLAAEKLGEGVKMESSANWVLCTKKIDQQQLVFFIYDKDKSEVVYEDMNPVRSVSWDSNNVIEVNPYDRIVREGSENKGYFIDLVTLQKKTINKNY